MPIHAMRSKIIRCNFIQFHSVVTGSEPDSLLAFSGLLWMVQGTDVAIHPGTRGTFQWHAAARIHSTHYRCEDHSDENVGSQRSHAVEEQRGQDGAQRHQAQRCTSSETSGSQSNSFTNRHKLLSEDQIIARSLVEHWSGQGNCEYLLALRVITAAAKAHRTGAILVLLAIPWKHATISSAITFTVATLDDRILHL